jgi:hypothetical protein
MAPGRPAVFPEQVGLALLTAAAIGGGVYVVVRILAG